MPHPKEKYWTDLAKKSLVGRKIVSARYMTDAEMNSMGWYSRPVVFQLDNGSLFFPSQDDEGNGAGTLFGQGPKGEELTMPVL